MLRPMKTLNQKKKIKEDKFITWLFNAKDTMEIYGKNILYSVGAVVVVVLIVFLVRKSGTSSQTETKMQLDQADFYAETNKPEDALTAYKDILQKFGKNELTGRACFSIAVIYYNKGEVDSAVYYYQKFLDKYEGDLLMPGAMAGIAMCLENKKEYAQAAEQYKKAVDKFPQSHLAPEYLMSAARCYQKTGNMTDANACYQKIVKNYKDSDYLRDAETADKMVVKK
jgi:TolA-binding protein